MVGQIGTFWYCSSTYRQQQLKFTEFLSRNPVGGAAIEDKYDEEYVIHILTEHAELNTKYRSLFNSQSSPRTEETEKQRKQNRNEIEQKNQSQTNKTFKNKNHVNKLNANGQSDITNVKKL